MINEKVFDVLFIGTSAPVAPQLFAFNFTASHVLLMNDAAVTMRCGFTTGLSTGSCILLTSGQQLFWQGLQQGPNQVALLCTSSSTAGFALRVGAWG